MDDQATEDVRQALGEFHRYLLDQIPPLTAADSIETLMAQKPELVMRQIQAWMAQQTRVQESIPISDYLFHALKKIHLFVDLKLIAREEFDAYAAGLIPLALEVCPASDREILKSHLASLRESQNVSISKVEIQRRASEPPARAAAAPTEEIARSARRFSLVIDRLTRQVAAAGTGPAKKDTIAQLMSLAASGSSSAQEFDEYMQRIRPLSGDIAENVFGILGAALPSWDVPIPIPVSGEKAAPPLKAMRRILSLSRDSTEGGKRFREMLTAAIEQFNAGSLSAAVSMFELAELVIVEKKLDPVVVERVRADTLEAISSEQLKKYVENKAKHPMLRKALGFFPSLAPDALLAQLRGEERADRRRSLLGLLEAHGETARQGAMAALDAELQKNPEKADTYFLRNLIYLMHRIPRASEEGIAKELELLGRASARGQNIYVVKEAINAFGQIKGEATVKLLTTRLAEFEASLVRNDASLYPIQEMQKVLDRIIAALARNGSPSALKSIARHGLKAVPQLGDLRARLANLSQYDLSFDEETVKLLIKAVREELPGKLLGLTIAKKPGSPIRLIEALSSTRGEAVQALFEEIAQKYPDQDFGKLAATALAKLAKTAGGTEAGAASLSGDLQFFGLPSLMQSLSESQATGIVTITNTQGRIAGKISFYTGGVLDAETDHLRGVDAVYQMLERPVVGSFAFVPRAEASAKGKGTPTHVMPLLLEGMRRHDELKQAATVAPDEIRLRASKNKPTPDPEETDPQLIRDVWLKAVSGSPMGEWEREVSADAYRIRRLVARWIEEEALQPIA